MTIKVCIGGVTGWAGSALTAAVAMQSDMVISGAVSRKHAGTRVNTLFSDVKSSVSVAPTVAAALAQERADVYVEYTHPDIAKDNVLAAIKQKASVVIGASGLSDGDYDEIGDAADENGVGVVAVGNFSISAMLLERFALEAARYMADWEIIDYASASKVDAPSGTTRQLAYRLGKASDIGSKPQKSASHEVSESRGAQINGSRIHSVRLPGYVIGVEIVFGADNQRLSIRHDAGADPGPYIAGALLAIRKVRRHVGLIRSLDELLG